MDEIDENNKIEKSETNEEEKIMTRFIGYFCRVSIDIKKKSYKDILGKTQLI
jgi:hypothetical protein